MEDKRLFILHIVIYSKQDLFSCAGGLMEENNLERLLTSKYFFPVSLR